MGYKFVKKFDVFSDILFVDIVFALFVEFFLFLT